MEQSRAEQRRAEQSRAERSGAEQSSAEQSRAEQSRAEEAHRPRDQIMTSNHIEPHQSRSEEKEASHLPRQLIADRIRPDHIRVDQVYYRRLQMIPLQTRPHQTTSHQIWSDPDQTRTEEVSHLPRKSIHSWGRKLSNVKSSRTCVCVCVCVLWVVCVCVCWRDNGAGRRRKGLKGGEAQDRRL